LIAMSSLVKQERYHMELPTKTIASTVKQERHLKPFWVIITWRYQ
jgi:hypothetical protein